MSSEELDSLNDESDNDGSDSRCSGTYYFSVFLHFENFVGHVGGLGSGVLVPTRVESKCDILEFVMFVPIGVKYKGGRLIEKLCAYKGKKINQTLERILTQFEFYDILFLRLVH